VNTTDILNLFDFDVKLRMFRTRSSAIAEGWHVSGTLRWRSREMTPVTRSRKVSKFMFSLHVEPVPHLLSPTQASISSILPHYNYKSPTTPLSDMHHLTCGISFLLHSIKSLRRCFNPDLKHKRKGRRSVH